MQEKIKKNRFFLLIKIAFLIPSFYMITNTALAMELYGTPGIKNFVKVMSNSNSYSIYAKDYLDEWKLLYHSNFIFDNNSIIAAGKFDDLILISFNCDKSGASCFMVFDGKTDQITNIYYNFKSLNSMQKVGFFYEVHGDKGLITIKPLFEPCKKPLTYELTVYQNSSLGVNTTFRKNGDLRVNYAAPNTADDANIIYHIDYNKLFADCRGT